MALACSDRARARPVCRGFALTVRLTRRSPSLASGALGDGAGSRTVDGRDDPSELVAADSGISTRASPYDPLDDRTFSCDELTGVRRLMTQERYLTGRSFWNTTIFCGF